MVPEARLVIPLRHEACGDESLVGGKAARLSLLLRAGHRVPDGFCVGAPSYETFVQESRIEEAIQMELGRKRFEDMRWEEIWDAALRIRSLFLARPLSARLRRALREALRSLGPEKHLAVRSSAPGEDSRERSFAGLHESVTGVRGEEALADAVRVVWASLWSDAALLYRQELQLHPARSRMAVLVQELVDADTSGVAFGRDPHDLRSDLAIVEAVPGRCSLLVDGEVDPDRWEIHRGSRKVATWHGGERDDGRAGVPLLEERELTGLLDAVLEIERLFDWAPDVEWTGRAPSLTILQARPIVATTAKRSEEDDRRDWYLTLRPGDARLRRLRDRVSGELIPALEAEGERFASQQLDILDDGALADAIEERSRSFDRWRKIYWEEFIPFAHGVRKLATFYNDAVRPKDPYEFVGLLRTQPLLALRRNQAFRALAGRLSENEELARGVSEALQLDSVALDTQRLRAALSGVEGAEDFLEQFEGVCERFLDITCEHTRLRERPQDLLRLTIELSRMPDSSKLDSRAASELSERLQERLLDAVGEERREEALEWIETGRISWKLRDDDNLLLARVESQLLRAVQLGARRLESAGRVHRETAPQGREIERIVAALRDPQAGAVTLKLTQDAPPRPKPAFGDSSGEARQLVGQPASPGLATGIVRCVRGGEDLGAFRRGEVLVCDAIQPAMTHLVPLAAAVVERRGGMLIHGAIIARELGIPCVNGVRKAADILTDGQIVTVDGHLGVVTLGEPEFSLELGGADAS